MSVVVVHAIEKIIINKDKKKGILNTGFAEYRAKPKNAALVKKWRHYETP